METLTSLLLLAVLATSAYAAVGDVCNEAEIECTTPNTECVTLVCRCKAGYAANLANTCDQVLNEDCSTNANYCDDLPFSECNGDKKCTCLAGYKPNDVLCTKVLGEDCIRNSDCETVESSICDAEKKCVCSTGYVANNEGTQCNKVLNEKCPTGGCDAAVPYSECNENDVCSCLAGYTATSGETRCSLKVGGPCGNNEECTGQLGPFSTCTDGNVCACNDGYSSSTLGTTCLKDMGLGGSCTDNTQCLANLGSNSTCLTSGTRRCACLPTYHYAQQKCYLTRVLNEECRDDAECQSLDNPENYACISNKCSCSKGHIPDVTNDQICINSALGGDCTVNSDCDSSVPNTECSAGGLCVCLAGFLPNEMEIQCAKVLGSVCVKNSDCQSVFSSICGAERKCVCSTGYLSNNEETKCNRVLYAPCPPRGCMSAVPNSECNENGLCSCLAGYAATTGDTRCSKAVGGSCEDNAGCSSLGPAGFCTDEKKCACSDGYSASPLGTSCLKDMGLGGSCVEETQCFTNLGTNSTCPPAPNRRCACLPNHHYTQEKCYLTRALNEKCSDDVECQSQSNPENYACIDNTCSCTKGNIPNNKICVSSGLGGDCVENSDCQSLIPNTECSAGRKCVCSTGFLANDMETRCDKVLNEACPPATSGGCNGAVPNSECKDEICSCRTGFVANSEETICLLTVGGPCVNDLSCSSLGPSDASAAVCGDDDTCVCNIGYSASISDTACLKDATALGGLCEENSQCLKTLGVNSTCTPSPVIKRCSCLTGYHYVEKKCYKTVALNAACTDDLECQESLSIPEYYACYSNLCSCSKGHLPDQNNNQLCVKSVLGGECVRNSDCQSATNTVCNDQKKCACSTGYLTNDMETQCVRVLGGGCIKDSECQSVVPNSVCNAQKKCECSTGYLTNNLQTQCNKVLNGACPPVMSGGCNGAVPDSECKADKCSCKSGFVANTQETKCLLTVGGPCADDVPCKQQLISAVCSDEKTCACLNGYSANPTGTSCLKDVNYGTSCVETTQCVTNLGVNSTCSSRPSRKCTCLPSYHYAQGKCYLTIALNGACRDSAECQSLANPENYGCIDNTCRCSKGKKPDDDNDKICVNSAGRNSVALAAIFSALFVVISRFNDL